MRFNIFPLVLLGSASVAILSAQLTRVEENDPSVTYTGTWATQTDLQASGGSYTSSNTAGSTVTFNFTGDTVTVYRLISNTTGGQADVTIDGKARGQLRFDGPGKFYLVPCVFDRLGPGFHTLVLSVNTTPNNLYAGTTVYIDAFETPSFFIPTAAQNTAFAAFNQFRTQLGLPAASRLSIPLSLAAQAHAEYLTQNNRTGAAENFGVSGFTGFQGSDRAAYFGYPIGASAPEVTTATADPVALINYGMSTMYKRPSLLAFGVTEIGFGSSGFINLVASDLMVANQSSSPPAGILVTYPQDGQTNVPVNYTEDPNGDPLPGVARPLGFPISLHIYPAPGQGTDVAATSGTLTDATGAAVNAKLIWAQNDSQIRDRNNYFLVPLAPLTPNMQYTAHITGIDAQQNKFDRSWKFTTAAAGTTTGPVIMPNLQIVAGSLIQISAGADGTVIGVNGGNQIWQWSSQGFAQLPGAAVNVAVVNANQVFAWNGYALYVWNGTGWSQIQQLPAGVTNFLWMSAAKDGTLYAVDQAGNINRRDAVTNAWSVVVQGAAVPAGHMAAQNGSTFYFIQSAQGTANLNGGGPGAIIKANINGTGLALPANPNNSAFVDVSVDYAGDLWAVDVNQVVYHWNGTGWDTLPGLLSQSAVGNASSLWGVDSQGAIYQWR